MKPFWKHLSRFDSFKAVPLNNFAKAAFKTKRWCFVHCSFSHPLSEGEEKERPNQELLLSQDAKKVLFCLPAFSSAWLPWRASKEIPSGKWVKSKFGKLECLSCSTYTRTCREERRKSLLAFNLVRSAQVRKKEFFFEEWRGRRKTEQVPRSSLQGPKLILHIFLKAFMSGRDGKKALFLLSRVFSLEWSEPWNSVSEEKREIFTTKRKKEKVSFLSSLFSLWKSSSQRPKKKGGNG